VRDLSQIADYFLFSTSDSSRQLRSIAEALDYALHTQSIRPGSIEGLESGRWLLFDAYDVVIHVFSPEARQYYDLELLWGDAPRMDWSAVETPEIPRQVSTRSTRVLRRALRPPTI
jgi:ribosome-associated protein